MTREVLNTVCGMDLKDINTQMALQCAPLIAGIKISNLFIIENDTLYDAVRSLEKLKLSYFILLRTADKTTFLLYDEEGLKKYLSEDGVRKLLRKMGYGCCNLIDTLRCFRIKYRQYASENKGFPHELGLFLGYPPEDVSGFIENCGENSLYTGYWKVYADLPAKLKLFRRYERAKESLIMLVSQGLSVADIMEARPDYRICAAAV